MKTVKIFGKVVPSFALVLALLGSIGFAVLLGSYGTLTGTTTVEQAVLVDGQAYSETPLVYGLNTVTAGSTDRSNIHTVKNNAEVDATIELSTLCQNSVGYDTSLAQTGMDTVWTGIGNNRCDGIVTSYVGVLELTSKDSNWQPTDDMNATLYYSLVGANFGYQSCAKKTTHFNEWMNWHSDSNY